MTNKTPLVLMLSRTDYSNVGAVFVKALNLVGVNAKIFQDRHTQYNPLAQAPLLSSISDKEISTLVKKSDVVLWMQTLKKKYAKKSKAHQIFENAIKNKNKRTAIFHGGTVYRENPNLANKIYQNVDIALTQTAEMLDKGAKNESWMLPAAFIHPEIKPRMDIGEKIVVGHFPSAPNINKKINQRNLSLKGSYLINEVMKEYSEVEYKFSGSRVSWNESLKRMNECDIYIESLNWASNSINKHDWSVTALEAAALGNIVITNFHFGYERYKKEYGKCELIIANTPKELRKRLDYLLSLNREELIELKKRTMDWANNVHGLVPTGKRLRKALGI